MSEKLNTCPLSTNDNKCEPMGCSCGCVGVELCRTLFRAYALGNHAATAKAAEKLKRIDYIYIGRQNGKTHLIESVAEILAAPEPPFFEELREAKIKVQIEQAEKYGAIID